MTRGASTREATAPIVRPLGDGAVLVELQEKTGLETSRHIRELVRRVAGATAGEPGWGAPIPGACSLLVPVDPLEPGTSSAADRLRAIVDDAGARAESEEGPDSTWPVLEIPTRYDGPDLGAVAEMTRLTGAGVVERHAAVTYTTLFLGFVPGFGYLGPLASELVLPRRPVPRTSVAAGSVAIAGPQTAVYPIESPGGWWLIGRAELVLWDARRAAPALLRPGLLVRFVPVAP